MSKTNNAVNGTQATNEVQSNKVNLSTEQVIKSIPRSGMSIKLMIDEVKKNVENDTMLGELLETYPDLFIYSLRHLVVSDREKCIALVQQRFPEFKITFAGGLSRTDRIEQITTQAKKMLDEGADKATIVDFIVDKQRKSDIKTILTNIL